MSEVQQPDRPGKPLKRKSSYPKGGKVTCEAAGWRFVPLPLIGANPFLPVGSRQAAASRHRYEGARGVEVIPPAESGIEPRHFGGMGRAVAWAVEELGKEARCPAAPIGCDGLRALAAAAMASGAISEQPDTAPQRADGKVISLARDILQSRQVAVLTRSGNASLRDPRGVRLMERLNDQKQAAEDLAPLQPITREGLIQKARAALAIADEVSVTASIRTALLVAVVSDLIELVPTLIDETGRSIVPGIVGGDG